MPNILERLASNANKKRKQLQSAAVDVVSANTQDDQKRRQIQQASQPIQPRALPSPISVTPSRLSVAPVTVPRFTSPTTAPPKPPTPFESDMQRFNGLTTQQRSHELGLDKPITMGAPPPLPSNYKPQRPGGAVNLNSGPTAQVIRNQPNKPPMTVVQAHPQQLVAPGPQPIMGPVHPAAPTNLQAGNKVITPTPGTRTSSPNDAQKLAQITQQLQQRHIAQAPMSLQTLMGASRELIARPATEIAATVTGKTFHPGNRVEKALLGPTEVQPIQQKITGAYKTTSQSNNPIIRNLAVPAAIGEGVLSVANDIPVSKIVSTGLKEAGKAAVPLVKTVADSKVVKEATSLTPRTTLNDQLTLQDLSNHLSGAKPLKPRELSDTITKSRVIAQKHGVELATGSPLDRLEKVNNVLDTLQQKGRLQSQGGAIGKDVTNIPDIPTLSPNAEARVFAHNPMVPTWTSPSGLEKARLETLSQENAFQLPGRESKIQSPSSSSANPLPIYNTKQVGNLDKAFRSTRSIIERQGEHGQQLAGMLQGARDSQELHLAELQKQMPTVMQLSRGKTIGRGSINNKDFENFVDATQGLAKPKNATVAKAIAEWQSTHPVIRNRAVGAGLEVGDLGPKYYPHFIDYEKVFKDTNTYNKAINHLVDTGQAADQEEAIKLLNYAKDVSRNRQFGNLEASRVVDLPFYDKTPNSLISYLHGSTKRIAQTETFGKQDENALKLITKAGQQGHDTEAMKNAYDVAVGAKQYNANASNISGAIRKYITTTRLGLGAITNVSQNVNTGIVTGHMRTLGAVAKQLSPKTRAFVGDTGVIADAVLNDLKTQAGYSSFSQKVAGKIVNKITAPGFGFVEKTNRSIAATAGRDYALRLAQKGDQTTLRKLGVKGEIKNKTLTEAQQIQAARKVVEKTQFKVDPQDLPGWTDSPGGKLVAQFRTFSYSQGKFVNNEILKPAAHLNFLPLGRLLAALPLGYALYETKRAIAGRPEEENKVKTGSQVFGNIGGAGLAFDLYQTINPIGSKYLPPDRRASMSFGAVGGPAVGTAAQAVSALSDLVQRKNLPDDPARLEGKVAIKGKDDYTDATPAARFALQQVPIVGTAVKNRLLPFQKESNADAGKTVVANGNKTLDSLVANKTQQDKNYRLAVKTQLSDKEKQLQKLNNAEQQQAIKAGVASKSDFENLDKKVNSLKSKYGQENIATQKQVKNYDKLDPWVQKFYDAKGETRSPSDSKKWEQAKTDKNGQDLIRRINQIRPADLPELPDNNKVASLYADFVQKRDEQKWSSSRTVIEQRKLLQSAYKTQVNEDDKFWLGQSDGYFRQAVESGDINKERLDKLVGYDNLQATLGGSAQIGKTVRRLLGYGDPPDTKYGGSKYSSSGASRGKKLKPSDFSLPTDILTKSVIKSANLAANVKLGGKG